MKRPYFAIVLHPNGEDILPCMDERGEDMLQFETYDDACEHAERTGFGRAGGYEVFNFEEDSGE